MCLGAMNSTQGGPTQRRAAPVAPISGGGARPMAGNMPPATTAPTGYSGPGGFARAVQTAGYGPPVVGSPGGSNPAANWAMPDSGLLGNSQYLALSRGNSADQAQLLGLLGGDHAAASQLNNYTGPGGAGFDPQGYGTGTAELAAGNYGVDTLQGPTRDAYLSAGIIGADGKWLKRQNAAGEWEPIGGAGMPAAPAGMASAYRT